VWSETIPMLSVIYAIKVIPTRLTNLKKHLSSRHFIFLKQGQSLNEVSKITN